MGSFQQLLLVGSALLLLSVITSKASGRFGIPALLLFLGIGMLPNVFGSQPAIFADPSLAQSLGIVALVLGVYAGGLDTDWRAVQPVLRMGLALSTLGVLVAAFLVALFAHWVFGFTLLEGLLLGAIVSSTDASTVFAMLRSGRFQLRGQLRPLLELEAGSNDPMAFFLTSSTLYLITHPEVRPWTIVPLFAVQAILGGLVGYWVARGAVWLVNHLRLEQDGLYPVLSLGVVLLTYSIAVTIGGNGFLAAYVCGLVMGNSDFIHKRTIVRFHDGLAWLMQILMFLTLGLLVSPARVVGVWGWGVLLVGFLAFLARPISVFLTLAPTGLDWRCKAMVAWVGLRGATPIILATFPLLAGLTRATLFFDLVFFVVTISLVFNSVSLKRVAELLGVTEEVSPRRRPPLEYVRTSGGKTDLQELAVPPDSAAIGHAIVELSLPKGTLVVLLGRGAEFMIPGGGTVIEKGDSLLVLADRESLLQTRAILAVPMPHVAAGSDAD